MTPLPTPWNDPAGAEEGRGGEAPVSSTHPGRGAPAAGLTEAQRETMRSIAVVGYAGLLTADEYEETWALANAGLIARDYSGAGGLMGLAKLVITDAGRAALGVSLPPQSAPDAPDAGARGR